MENSPINPLIENRDEVRFSLSGKLPVSFHYGPQNKTIEALFVDISHQGLGLLINDQNLNIGDIVSMQTEQGKTYSFQVIWLKKTRMRGTASELIRVGLQCKDSQVDLIKDFADSSLIDL